jgi:hypothetical protein
MTTPTFPTLPGITWDIKKRVLWSTDVETSASGAEFRTGRWTAPIYEFDLVFAYLSQTDQQTLQTFFEGQQGSYLPFYLPVANDPASPFLVRFVDDKLEFNQMLSQMYEVQGITMRTVR